MRISSSCRRTLSHEVKTALTGILSNAELLRSNKLSPPEVESCINDIYHSGMGLLAFINTILGGAKHTTDNASIRKISENKSNKISLLTQNNHWLNVLLVEDDPIVQRVHSKMLQDLGCHVEVAKNSHEAIRMLTDKHHYEIIFMDIGLPDMDGIQTVERIRKQENNKSIPIIGLTAYQVNEIKLQCQSVGFNKVVSKPISLEVLKNILPLIEDIN